MTLRLSADGDETLERLAKAFRTSKNTAAAAAIELAAPRENHPEFVAETTRRLMTDFAPLMARLAEV